MTYDIDDLMPGLMMDVEGTPTMVLSCGARDGLFYMLELAYDGLEHHDGLSPLTVVGREAAGE